MAVPSAGKTYVVCKGDSLSGIAQRFGVSARELASINGVKDANKIRVGQKIVLPDYASVKPGAAAPRPVAAQAPAPPAAGGSLYVVQAGDSLSKIASKQGVKLSALREANAGKIKGDRILVGQKLAIPGKAAPAAAEPVATPTVEPVAAPVEAPAVEPPPAPDPAAAAPALSAPGQEQPLDYTVQPDDTVDSIARLFIVRKEDIMKLNNITDPASLKPGQRIKIPPTSF